MGITPDDTFEDPPAPEPIRLPDGAPAWAELIAFRLGQVEQNCRYIPGLRVRLAEIARGARRRTVIFTIIITALVTAMAGGVVQLLIGLNGAH